MNRRSPGWKEASARTKNFAGGRFSTGKRTVCGRGDVPYFWCCAGERTLRGDRQGTALIENFLQQSAIACAKRRISAMNEQDLSVQCAYIRSGLRQMDDWTDSLAFIFPAPAVWAGAVPEPLPEPLPAETAVREVTEALHRLWDERIPLSAGCCLWHVPMFNGRPQSLYGLSAGFSGVGVFCRAAEKSLLLSERDRAIAKELSEACFQDMMAFAGFLLNEYPDPPEERIIRRRFEGGFGFGDGLAGLLWALEQYRDGEKREDRQASAAGQALDGRRVTAAGRAIEIGRILEAFQCWNLPICAEETWERIFRGDGGAWPDTDVLAGGLSGRAALLLREQEAGRLLSRMYERKEKNGCYQIFRKGRKQYFLPALLRGSLGIAAVMLRYAELS